jgi:hypothetical protein
MLNLDLCKLEAKVALSFVQTAMFFSQTVRGNMEGYMQFEVEEACAAREAQAMLGHPAESIFLEMVRSLMLVNCPVSPTAMLNINCIFGPNLAGERRQMVRRPPESVTMTMSRSQGHFWSNIRESCWLSTSCL